MSTPRNRIFSSDNFVAVGIPEDESGNDMRRFLSKKEKSGDCRIVWDGPKIHHSDGKIYVEIKIYGKDAEFIASEVLNLSPGNEYQTIAGPCESCRGKGCADCGYSGVQALY